MHEHQLTTVLWRGKWLILASMAAAAVLAVLVTEQQAKVYEAHATLEVSSPQTGLNASDMLQRQQASTGLATTYATVINTRSFLDGVRGRIDGGRHSTTYLLDNVSAKPVADTGLIDLRTTGPSPDAARRLAVDTAQAFLQNVQQGAQQRFAQQQEDLQSKIASVSTRIDRLLRARQTPATAEEITSLRTTRSFLTQQLAQIASSAAQQGGSVALVAPPAATPGAVSPRPRLNLAAGLLLGLLLGVALAYLRSRLDRGLRTAQEVEQLGDAPVLASIPLRRRYSSEDPVLGEAYDILRANLAFLSLDSALQVLTFSSYSPGEGKSSTVDGLAHAAVRAGMRCLVVDGDVRTRTLTDRFGYLGAPGLTNVVVGGAEVEEAIVELAPNLAFLPTGPVPPNPPSLLSSGRARGLLEELREDYELILVDSPPVAHLADASILAAASDGVVVVARVGVTERAHLPAAVANLRQVPTPLVGFVLLEPKTIDQTYYPALSRGAPQVADTSPAA
jgi:capsular exopolysaccharide synthesis family protein